MSKEPENLVLELLRGIRADMVAMGGELRSDMTSLRAELKGDIAALRADVASDLVLMEARNMAEHKKTRDDTRDQITGLRRSVMQYHSTDIGTASSIPNWKNRCSEWSSI